MSGFGASQLKLSLEIGQRHIDIAHRHGRTGVAEQFHHGSKAHASPKHFRSIGMSHLVGDDISGKADSVADHMQVIAEPSKESYFSSRPSQKPSIGRQRIQRAEEAQAVGGRHRWQLWDRAWLSFDAGSCLKA